MLKQMALGFATVCSAAALCGCPNQAGGGAQPAVGGKSSTPSSATGQSSPSASQQPLAQAGQDFKQGAEELGQAAQQGLHSAGEKAQQLGGEIKQGTQQAGQNAKAGYANFSEDVKQKYPKVVESMQKQFDAMNKWAVTTYGETFSSDAPDRDKLVGAFKDETQYKPQYSIDSFVVDSKTDTAAVATVELTYTGTDVAKPQASQHKKYRYTFHKEPKGDDWKVYKIEPLS
jgi:hypothetical protein